MNEVPKKIVIDFAPNVYNDNLYILGLKPISASYKTTIPAAV